MPSAISLTTIPSRNSYTVCRAFGAKRNSGDSGFDASADQYPSLPLLYTSSGTEATASDSIDTPR